jgi:tricarballylate dehydrogenase
MLDVLVIGGGNVALTAALMAREAGASVLMPEASPREWRGGNSQHMRNLRCMHAAPRDVTQRSLGLHASMPAVDPEQPVGPTLEPPLM